MKTDGWFKALQAEAQKTSINKTARRIGYSPSVVSQVLSGVYEGNLDNVKSRVEGALMNHTVECPVSGEIKLDTCLDNQALPFSTANPFRVQIYKACRRCPHSRIGEHK